MTDATARTIPTIAQMRDNSLSGVVRHEIETLILSGELPAGGRVNENPIAGCSCDAWTGTTWRRSMTCVPV